MTKIYNYPTKQAEFFENADTPDEGIMTRNWGDFAALTIKEVWYLSLGVNPLTVHLFWDDLKKWTNECVKISANRITEIKRAVHANVIRRVDPSSDVNEDTLVFAKDVERYFNGADDKPEIKILMTTTERAILIKLVTGMAIDKYGYNPNSARNLATGEKKGSIKYALEKISPELSVCNDTIRSYVNEGTDFLTLDLLKIPAELPSLTESVNL